MRIYNPGSSAVIPKCSSFFTHADLIVNGSNREVLCFFSLFTHPYKMKHFYTGAASCSVPLIPSTDTYFIICSVVIIYLMHLNPSPDGYILEDCTRFVSPGRIIPTIHHLAMFFCSVKRPGYILKEHGRHWIFIQSNVPNSCVVKQAQKCYKYTVIYLHMLQWGGMKKWFYRFATLPASSTTLRLNGKLPCLISQ